MTRAMLILVCGLVLTACSGGDVQQMAENVRIRAEGVGARTEAERSDRKLAEAGGTVYREAPQEEAVGAQGERTAAGAEAAIPEEKAPPPPPPPIYVIVPAN